ncbi:hypothetical protein PsorP6_011664 [Peronosclerospora sorghi]|uniref:Uncharacterized protein n=1 Tax=Peronosclerospora sorghi TaxID=230839 RepID=A0ACC0WLL4_9STRA|nr:hypothetical protein PsorP6_011664 [Peronosclerospora sorghi]
MKALIPIIGYLGVRNPLKVDLIGFNLSDFWRNRDSPIIDLQDSPIDNLDVPDTSAVPGDWSDKKNDAEKEEKEIEGCSLTIPKIDNQDPNELLPIARSFLASFFQNVQNPHDQAFSV